MIKQTSALQKVMTVIATFLLLRSCYATYHYRQLVNASKGIDYYDEGCYREAVPRLQALRELEPTEIGLNSYLGYSFFQIKDYPAAIESYKALIKANAADYDDFYYLGVCPVATGSHDEAVSDWQEGLKRAKRAYRNEISHEMAGSSMRLAYIKDMEHCLSASIDASKKRSFQATSPVNTKRQR